MSADTTYPSTFQVRQDGNAAVPTGKALDVESGASLKLAGTALTGTAAELNARVTGQPTTATIAPAAGGANVCLVTITVLDGTGTAVTTPVHLDVTLSDAATGAGLTATTASGAVAAGASGVDLVTLVSKKALRVQTTAAGVYILSITDTAKTGFYVTASVPGQLMVVSAQLVTGNYG